MAWEWHLPTLQMDGKPCLHNGSKIIVWSRVTWGLIEVTIGSMPELFMVTRKAGNGNPSSCSSSKWWTYIKNWSFHFCTFVYRREFSHSLNYALMALAKKSLVKILEKQHFQVLNRRQVLPTFELQAHPEGVAAWVVLLLLSQPIAPVWLWSRRKQRAKWH